MLKKDVVLRKTTFDECKGDKFEELLAGFANVVLRQQLRNGATAAPKLQIDPEHNCLPIILAHRVSLKVNLERRQALRAKLIQHQQDASERNHRLMRTKKELSGHQTSDSVVRDTAERSLRIAWAADPSWIDALLGGSPPGQSSSVGASTSASEQEPEPVLQTLQDLVTQQDAQLARWAAFKSMLPTENSEPREKRGHEQSSQRLITFDKHKMLSCQQAASNTALEFDDPGAIQKRHRDLLDQLSNELRSSGAVRTSMNCDIRTDSETPPQFQTQASSQSRISEPIGMVYSVTDETAPLETPVKTKNQDGHVQMIRPLDEEAHSTNEEVLTHTAFEIKVGSPDSSWTTAAPTTAAAAALRPYEPPMPTDSHRDVGVSTGCSPPATPLPTAYLDLQERTRVSLAGALRHVEKVPSSPLPRIQQSEDSDDQSETPRPFKHDGVGNLAQRTRKSMSLLTTIADMKTSRRSSKGPRHSQLYPINPFETPRKTSLQYETHTPGSNDSTPREKLFSEEADMSSVFKSRPKIALSPTMSPDRSVIEEDSVLAGKAGDLYLGDDSGVGSP